MSSYDGVISIKYRFQCVSAVRPHALTLPQGNNTEHETVQPTQHVSDAILYCRVAIERLGRKL